MTRVKVCWPPYPQHQNKRATSTEVIAAEIDGVVYQDPVQMLHIYLVVTIQVIRINAFYRILQYA